MSSGPGLTLAQAEAEAMHAASRQAADAALNECRQILGAPSRLAMWWVRLRPAERRIIAQAAGVSELELYDEWDGISNPSRVALVNAARRAAAWAQVLVDGVDAYRPADALAARSERLVREGGAAP